MIIATLREDDTSFKVETKRFSGYYCDLHILPYKFQKATCFFLHICAAIVVFCDLRIFISRERWQILATLFFTRRHIFGTFYIFGTLLAQLRQVLGQPPETVSSRLQAAKSAYCDFISIRKSFEERSGSKRATHCASRSRGDRCRDRGNSDPSTQEVMTSSDEVELLRSLRRVWVQGSPFSSASTQEFLLRRIWER